MKKIEQLILKFINEHALLKTGEKILIALSGGPDSVFLLHFLQKYKNKYKIETGAVHINHKLRGKNSDADEKFCVDLCMEYGLPLYSASKNVKQYAQKNKQSLEEAAREVRYSVFNKVAEQYGYNKIATAHNLSDNTETVLLNLIKGTGLKGIAGIPIVRGNIIRPVLPASKKEILNYLNFYGIQFRIDESNNDTVFERNFLRNEIVPLLRSKLNPAVEQNIFKSADIYKKYISAFEYEVEKYTRESVLYNKDEMVLDISRIENPFLVNDVIIKALKQSLGYSCSYDDLKKISGLNNKKNSKRIELKDNLTAFKENGKICIRKNAENPGFEEKTISVGEKICVNDKEELYISLINRNLVCFSDDKNEEYISGDNLGSEFVVRRWKAGDKFKPLGLKGTKKISDFLNDAKISQAQKENQLLLTQNGKVIWVIGLRTDDRFKMNVNTKKVLALCLKKTL